MEKVHSSKPETNEPMRWARLGPVQEYWLDAWQRSVLLLDVLRQRGNRYLERSTSPVPHVLDFKTELVRDGRTLARPVNYVLVGIVPPEGAKIDPTKSPFIIVDPRAGHGPGIGGMKRESEIGVALAAGHPCYFVGFLPEPMPGQTVEDVCLAEATFVEEVAARHPTAEGKPVVIANCQAGWQIMMMAAIKPDLAGPIMLAGSPLSYWAGVRGKNPMRYLGGVLGGTWLTALAGDLGRGIFDGAHLIANFESLNPANTYWQKIYNVYSKVDTEAQRFLDFETWWGSPVLLNAEEMQWIADNLFVGNKLATGRLRTSDGFRIDLRNIKSPIIVFCSWGDDITPPQQALGWVTDLYDHESEIIANGQTIVYTLHQTIGHLGIFVSGKVASKEHGEFASCMEMIDLLPPGLYEAVITEVDEDTENPSLIQGKYLFTLEARTLDDIRALGANSPEDDRRFATVARISEANHRLYRTLVGPAVRAMTAEPVAKAIRQMHPNRLRFAVFSDRNPLMGLVKVLAERVRAARCPVSVDNPLLALEKTASSWIAACLEAYGTARDAMTEALFLNVYGSPLLQAMVGLGPQVPPRGQQTERDLVREAAEARARSELEKRFEVGGLREATIRALVYVRLPEGSVDERGFAMLSAIRAAQPAEKRLTMGQLKEALKEQFLLVYLDEERAIQAIPKLLPRSVEERRAALKSLHRMFAARGALPEEGQRRLSRVEALFDVKLEKPSMGETAYA
jgi:pimeloyl-ACP methyl ester carboxylesterase